MLEDVDAVREAERIEPEQPVLRGIGPEDVDAREIAEGEFVLALGRLHDQKGNLPLGEALQQVIGGVGFARAGRARDEAVRAELLQLQADRDVLPDALVQHHAQLQRLRVGAGLGIEHRSAERGHVVHDQARDRPLRQPHEQRQLLAADEHRRLHVLLVVLVGPGKVHHRMHAGGDAREHLAHRLRVGAVPGVDESPVDLRVVAGEQRAQRARADHGRLDVLRDEIGRGGPQAEGLAFADALELSVDVLHQVRHRLVHMLHRQRSVLADGVGDGLIDAGGIRLGFAAGHRARPRGARPVGLAVGGAAAEAEARPVRGGAEVGGIGGAGRRRLRLRLAVAVGHAVVDRLGERAERAVGHRVAGVLAVGQRRLGERGERRVQLLKAALLLLDHLLAERLGDQHRRVRAPRHGVDELLDALDVILLFLIAHRRHQRDGGDVLRRAVLAGEDGLVHGPADLRVPQRGDLAARKVAAQRLLEDAARRRALRAPRAHIEFHAGGRGADDDHHGGADAVERAVDADQLVVRILIDVEHQLAQPEQTHLRVVLLAPLHGMNVDIGKILAVDEPVGVDQALDQLTLLFLLRQAHFLHQRSPPSRSCFRGFLRFCLAHGAEPDVSFALHSAISLPRRQRLSASLNMAVFMHHFRKKPLKKQLKPSTRYSSSEWLSSTSKV